jgi:hypothetical protein
VGKRPVTERNIELTSCCVFIKIVAEKKKSVAAIANSDNTIDTVFPVPMSAVKPTKDPFSSIARIHDRVTALYGAGIDRINQEGTSTGTVE